MALLELEAGLVEELEAGLVDELDAGLVDELEPDPPPEQLPVVL